MYGTHSFQLPLFNTPATCHFFILVSMGRRQECKTCLPVARKPSPSNCLLDPAAFFNAISSACVGHINVLQLPLSLSGPSPFFSDRHGLGKTRLKFRPFGQGVHIVQTMMHIYPHNLFPLFFSLLPLKPNPNPTPNINKVHPSAHVPHRCQPAPALRTGWVP